MQELSLLHIETIASDIRREGISYSHLADDIIDHVCCDVEYHMQQGLDFSEAYRIVRQKFGSSRRIREIQEETLYAVDLKYRKMKNTMKISAVTGTIIFGLAAMFKIQHWPGAGIMLTLGAMILAFLFMPSALIVLWKETKDKRSILMLVSGFLSGLFLIIGTLFKVQHWPAAGLFLAISVMFGFILFIPAVVTNRARVHSGEGKTAVYIAAGIGVICFMLGMFFKLQHWPLASGLLVTGLIITGVVAIPWYTYVTWHSESTISPKFIFIVIAALLILIPGTLVNLNIQRNFDNGFFITIEKQHSLYRALKESNEEFVISLKDQALFSTVEDVHNATIKTLRMLESTEQKLIAASENSPDLAVVSNSVTTAPDQDLLFSFGSLRNAFDTQPVENYLMPGCEEREVLIKEVNSYTTLANNILTGSDSVKVAVLLNPVPFLPGEKMVQKRIPLIAGLTSIELIKTNILIAERTILKKLTGSTI